MLLKVLIVSNIPSPYFVNYCDELGKYVDLTVLFELKNAKDRDETWRSSLTNRRFKYVFLNGRRFSAESGLSFKVKKYLKDRSYDRVIIANPSTPTGIISLLYCRRKKIPFILQSEGGFQGSGKGFKERFKKYLMENATMYLTGMGGDDDYFLKYGATKEKLKSYYFTSSYGKDIDDRVLSFNEKKALKQQLGVKTSKMILYVGQFIYRKGIDILLKSIEKNYEDVSIYLIGGELTKEYDQIISENNIKNVFAKPFMSKEELRAFYQAADIFVMTTREDTWGLVVNEAMEHGLPVITTTRCIAGKNLIEDGLNGYLVPPENFELTRKRIDELLNNSKLCEVMGKNNLNKIKSHTIENMALTIYKYIK